MPALLLSMSLLGFIASPQRALAESTTIYYYNPDSNLTDYAGLKRIADGFLREFGDFQFQPFRDGAVFDMHTLVNSDGITILPSWKFESLREDRAGFFTLRPHWVGTREGNRAEVRLVVAMKQRPMEFSKITIASSIGASQCIRLLEAAFPEQPVAEAVEILSVPRDSDAAFAVLFGEADAAVVTSRSLEMISPSLRESGDSFVEWARTVPVLAPVVVADENDIEAQQHIKKVFSLMAGDSKGHELLSLLGLDGWQSIDDAQLTSFERQGGE